MEKKDFLKELRFFKRPLLRLTGCKLLGALAACGAAWQMAVVVDQVFLHGMKVEKAVPPLAALLFLLLARHGSSFLAGLEADGISAALRQKMRKRIWETMLSRSPLSPSLSSSGDLLTLAFETVDGIDDFCRKLLPLVIEGAVTFPLLIAVALGFDAWTALLFLLTLPIAPFLLSLIGHATKSASEREWQELSHLSAAFAELLHTIAGLKIFRQSVAQYARLAELSERFSAASLSVLRLAFVSAFMLELITTLSIAIVAVSVGLRLLHGELDFFTAFFVLLLAPEFYQPLRESGLAFHAGVSASAAAENIAAFLEAEPPPSRGKRLEKLQVPPAIRFDNVSFSYPGRKALALKGISFSAPAGKLTVLKGTSGCGKSTALALIARHGEPSAGRIEVGGLPLHGIEPAAWRTRISYVPQQPHLFRATLRENVTLHFDAADTDDASVRAALAAAALTGLAASLPEGLDTMLGEGCRSLSFGQLRRLGLARAIWQDAPVFLLDEITAGLDEENEQEILAALEPLRRRRTILMATHRPAVFAVADKIIDLEGADAE